MAKYRKRPVIIEAEQYFVGKPCTGVKVTNPEIIYSYDDKLFYITHCGSTEWLSVEPKEGKYKAYPFAFYEIKSGKREPIQNKLELVDLYMDLFDLKYPKAYAWVETIHDGQTVEVKDGDFIIPESDGIHYYPCKPEEFANNYELVED